MAAARMPRDTFVSVAAFAQPNDLLVLRALNGTFRDFVLVAVKNHRSCCAFRVTEFAAGLVDQREVQKGWHWQDVGPIRRGARRAKNDAERAARVEAFGRIFGGGCRALELHGPVSHAAAAACRSFFSRTNGDLETIDVQLPLDDQGLNLHFPLEICRGSPKLKRATFAVAVRLKHRASAKWMKKYDEADAARIESELGSAAFYESLWSARPEIPHLAPSYPSDACIATICNRFRLKKLSLLDDGRCLDGEYSEPTPAVVDIVLASPCSQTLESIDINLRCLGSADVLRLVRGCPAMTYLDWWHLEYSDDAASLGYQREGDQRSDGSWTDATCIAVSDRWIAIETILESRGGSLDGPF